MYADLLFYFQTNVLDVFEEGSRLTPRLVLALIQRLPDSSMTYSLMHSREDYRSFMDRTPEWWVMADLFDATNQGTRATGQWRKGKAPTFEPYPRPNAKQSKKAAKKAKKTHADVIKMFGGFGQH